MQTPAHKLRSGLRAVIRPGLASTLLVAAMSVSLWTSGNSYIDNVSSSLLGIRRLVAADSQHYLDIADDLRAGDFSMSFVKPAGGDAPDRAHRQPGYPAVLAVAEAWGLSGAPEQAKIDVLLLVASLWVALAVGTWVCGSALGGALAAAIIYQCGFLFGIATERLLTEPLYVLVSTATIGAALAYLKRNGLAALLAGAVLAGLAYLTRVNGLMLAAALAAVMVASDVAKVRAAAAAAPPPRRPQREPNAGGNQEEDEEEEEEDEEDRPLLPMARYLAALALFLVVAAPSWVPRLLYAGNPLYHGYLPNYLWVDQSARAHLPGPPRYGWGTYWEDHSVVDAARRLAYGVSRVYWETPRDKIGVAASLIAAAAIAALVLLRDRAALWLLVAAILQTLPLAWTAMANPSRRLPAAALLPFVAVLAAEAVARCLERAGGRPSTNGGSQEARAAAAAGSE